MTNIFIPREYTTDLKISTPFCMETQVLLSFYGLTPSTILELKSMEDFDSIPFDEIHTAKLIFSATPEGFVVNKYSFSSDAVKKYSNRTLTPEEMQELVDSVNAQIIKTVMPWVDKCRKRLKEEISEVEERLSFLKIINNTSAA